MLIGTDCPVLDAADLGEAAAALSHADVALAPAEDGGYGLIAARRPLPELFEEMPWGSDRVAELTRERARGEGLRLAELRTIWDVDNGADLERLRGVGLIDLADLTRAAPIGDRLDVCCVGATEKNHPQQCHGCCPLCRDPAINRAPLSLHE